MIHINYSKTKLNDVQIKDKGYILRLNITTLKCVLDPLNHLKGCFFINSAAMFYLQRMSKISHSMCLNSMPAHYLQRCNYQVNKEIVHELKCGDIAVMQI